tara:strand:+ start:2666 stop:3025 length:360 start_codon:yes stop_codon:yes gene_type:complete
MVNLNEFTGSSQFFKLGGFSKSVITEGVQYLATTGRSGWLITDLDAIINFGKDREKFRGHPMLVAACERRTGILTITDGNDNVLFKRTYNSVDLPENEVTIWLCQNELGSFTFMLPSEY